MIAALPLGPRRLRRCVAVFSCAIAATFAADQKPATDEAALQAFGEEIAALLDSGGAAEVYKRIDFAALGSRMVSGLGLTPTEERDLLERISRSLESSLTRRFSTFESARFLRLQRVGNETRLLLRVLTEGGGLNYMAFICAPHADAPQRWADVFIYLSGETLSQSLRRTVIPPFVENKKGFRDRLTSAELAYLANFEVLMNANAALQGGDHAKAFALMDKLPASVKRDRTVLLLRFRSAQPLGENKYLEVINDWEAAFPNDSTLDLVSIDGDLLRKNYAGALKRIDSLSKRIGSDAYLDYLGANVLIAAGQFDEAKRRANAALAAESDLASAFDALIEITLKTKNYPETVRLMDEVKKRYPKLNLEEVVRDASYADFRASEVYRAWIKRGQEQSDK